MKKFVCVLLLFCLLLVGLSANKSRAYAGIGYASFEVSGFEDICLTDYPAYSGTQEGRVALNMESSNGKNDVLGGILGFEYSLLGDMDNLIVLLEVGVYGGKAKSFLIDSFAGVMGRIPLGPVSIGLGVKAGYSALNIELGKLKVMSGFRAPVIIDWSYYYTGDDIQYYNKTLSLLPVADIKAEFGGLSLNLSAAYHISLFSLDDYFKIGGKKLNASDSHFIEYSELYAEHTRSSMDPSLKIGKFKVQCCVGYSF